MERLPLPVLRQHEIVETLMDSSVGLDLLRLVAVGLLVLANAFFVSAEFSLVSVRRTRIAELVTQGNASAVSVQKALENPDRVIAATQLGITLASLGLGWIGEPALSHLFAPIVTLAAPNIQDKISHSISAGVAFAFITFLHVVVGELAPKSIALQDPEKTSLIVARPTLWTEFIFKPVILVLNGTGNLILRLIGIKPAFGHQLVHSVEELRMLVSASADEGVMEQDEREMLDAIFDLGEQDVGQMMVPRTEILAVEADTPINELLNIVTQSTYTKLPVYEDDLDQIIGILHIKDLLRSLHQTDSPHKIARDITREAIYVPETIPVSTLLQQFRANRQHIAIVLDEYGGTAGLVTLEDLLEEIVGEVSDPFDQVDPEIQPQPDGSLLIDGMTLIEEVNQQLGLTLSDPYYYTIAGFVLAQLGRIPQAGDVVEQDGVYLKVNAMDDLRIASVLLQRKPQQTQ
jgi:CBS domain containing-hemolysin-like protein